MNTWILNENEYEQLIFDARISFTISFGDDSCVSEYDDTSGSLSFKVVSSKITIGAYERFNLTLRGGDFINVYRNCTFHKTPYLEASKRDTNGRNILNGVSVSIKYEGKETFHINEYRETIIDNLMK